MRTTVLSTLRVDSTPAPPGRTLDGLAGRADAHGGEAGP